MEEKKKPIKMNNINIRQIRNLKKPFMEFINRLGISLESITENLNNLYHIKAISSNKISKVPYKLYRELSKAYGKFFLLEIGIGGIREYSQTGPVNIKKLKKFRNKLKSKEIVGTLDVDISIDKEKLAKRILRNPGGIIATIVFQLEVLLGILSEPIVDLDKRSILPKNKKENEKNEQLSPDAILYDDSCKQLILIPDLNVLINGERLAIIGGLGLMQIKKVLIPPPSKEYPSPEAIRRVSESNIKWIRLSPLNLTPIHFDVMSKKRFTGKKVAKILYLISFIQASLSLMYLGDSITNESNGDLKVIFIRDKNISKVNLPIRLPQDEQFRKVLKKGAALWYEEFYWVYGNKRFLLDRFTITQAAIANAFTVTNEFSQMANFLDMADPIHRLIREQWKIFMSDKVDKHFEIIKLINEFITSATRAYRERVDTLIKSLCTTMLGAVVTVVGSFVGSLLSDKFNPTIMIIGLTVYFGYLAIFPGVIGMTNARQSFNDMKNRMNQQFSELKYRNLSLDKKKKKWESLKEQLVKSEKRFEDWFEITKLVYIVVCCMIIIAIMILLTIE